MAERKPNNHIEGNRIILNATGLEVNGAGSFIAKNSASDNTSSNYEIAANNKVGSIISASNSGVISGDTGGSGVGSTDPWANFTF